MHCQFSNPASTKLKGLLTDGNVIDKELYEIIDHLDENCEICEKFKRPKLKPVICFPLLAQCFNQTLALDLKWSSSSKYGSYI